MKFSRPRVVGVLLLPGLVAFAAGAIATASAAAVTTTAGVSAAPTLTSAAPAVTAITPTVGGIHGGTRLTLAGRNFSPVTGVMFDRVRGTAVKVLSTTKIQVTAPSHARGTVWVRVVARAGTSEGMSYDRYSYLPKLAVSSVTPRVGTTLGGTRVTLHGANFIHVTAVTFGGVAGRGVTMPSPDTLVVTTPMHASGILDVRVVTTTGISPVVSADRFEYKPMTTVQSFQYAGTSDPNQSLTATWLPTRVNAPWVVTIHGGSWINGSQLNDRGVANNFYSHGWQAFNLSYRVGLTVSNDEQVADMLSARNWIVAHAARFGINPNRGAVYGSSSGGQMAATLGLAGGFRVVVSVSGVLQPQWIAEDVLGLRPGETATDSMRNAYIRMKYMMGCDYEPATNSDACADRWRAFSPVYSVTPAAPAFFIVQGGDDPAIEPSSTIAFGDALTHAGVANSVSVVPGYVHSVQCAWDTPAKQHALFQYTASHST